MDFSLDLEEEIKRLLQEIKNSNSSLVIRDRRGYIYRKLINELKEKGYEIKILDLGLTSGLNLDFYNPLKYVDNLDDLLALSEILANNQTYGIGLENVYSDFVRKAKVIIYSLLREEFEKGKIKDTSFASLRKRFHEQLNENKCPWDFVFSEDIEKWQKDRYEGMPAWFSGNDSLIFYVDNILFRLSSGRAEDLFSKDTLNLKELLEKKTAIFLEFDEDREPYGFIANILYMQILYMFNNKKLVGKESLGLLIDPKEVTVSEMILGAMRKFIYKV